MKSLTITIGLALACASAIGADDMKGMEMKDMSPSRMAKDAGQAKHVAKGIVKKIDAKAGTVSLEHQAVKSLNWPAMTMTFKVQDKALLEKLNEGKKVEVEFEQRGKDYVITSAKAG
jgi:Cu(I)/Ag(I) efflux system periplasmic protein CusF